MTLFDLIASLGQAEVDRRTGLGKMTISRVARFITRVNDRVLDACERAWSDFDRAGTVVEWDRGRSERIAAEKAVAKRSRRNRARKARSERPAA